MRYFFAFVLSFFFATITLAAQVGGLYRSIIWVADQSEQTREAAMPVALKRVVQKVSGSNQTSQHVGLQASLSQTDAFVEQFKYQKNEGDKAGYWLTTSFQKMAVDQVLQQHDFPVWGSNRPDVLLWLAINNKQQAKYLASSGQVNVSAIIKKAANEAGLSIALPLLDAEDQRALKLNDVWNDVEAQINAASKRYGVKYVLHGQVIQVKQGDWTLRWRLMDVERQTTSGVSTMTGQPSLAQVLHKGFLNTTEQLANRYAPRGLQLDTVVAIQVSGIQGLSDFSRIENYLSSLEVVKAVSWEGLNEGSARFNVDLTGNAVALEQLVSLSHVLMPDTGVNQRIEMVPQSNGGDGRSREIRVLYYRVN